MATYGMVDLNKVQATYAGNIVTLKHSADVENGTVCNLGALVTGETEMYAVGVPATATLASAEVVLVASPEVIYEGNKSMGEFVNKTGKPIRGYHLTVGDVFTVSDNVLDGTSVVGKYLIPQNGSLQLAVADDLTGGTRFAAQIIQLRTLGYDGSAATRVRVIKV